MVNLFVVALFFSAVAARPDPWKQWQRGSPPSSPFGGPPENTNMLPKRPNDRGGARPQFGGQPMGGGKESQEPMGGGPLWPWWDVRKPGNPTWPKETPPWLPERPTAGPGNGAAQPPSSPQPGPGNGAAQPPSSPQPGPGNGAAQPPSSPQPGPGNGAAQPPSSPQPGPGNGAAQPPSSPQPGGPPLIPERGDRLKDDWGPWWEQGTMGDLASPPSLPPLFGPGFGYKPEGAGAYPGQEPQRGPRGRPEKPGGPRGGARRPNTRDRNRRPGPMPPFPGAGNILIGGKPLIPEIVGNREFFPFLKVDNVTFQNVSDLPLKEGENLFLLPMDTTRPPPPMVDPNAPQRQLFGNPSYNLQPYLKLIYNPTATRKISFEYGLTTLLPFGKCWLMFLF
ncbi:basic salivary proline-rich protein 1-like [Osmerus eperlanus]|uniref:basic salivary proline-rich protein 1-like n=1 Tax=Osmerus eperlanus TaxID=29151 RepID=UPI002E101D4A